MLGHLGALVPGQRSAQLLGQRRDRVARSRRGRPRRRDRRARAVLCTRLVAVAVHARQVQQHREPGGALDERADRGAVEPDDEVAFPVAGHGPVVGLGGPLADQDLGGDERSCRAPGARPRHPQRAPGAQAGDELAAAARRGPGRRAPGRSPRARSASTHHRGSRPAAGSRSAPGSTTSPTPVLPAPVTRPIQRTSGPGTGSPSGAVIVPASRSCTYCTQRLVGGELSPDSSAIGATEDDASDRQRVLTRIA